MRTETGVFPTYAKKIAINTKNPTFAYHRSSNSKLKQETGKSVMNQQ